MTTTTTTWFHVYAEDGFESSHRSEAAATRAAQRGFARRRVHYRVVRSDVHGATGGGRSTLVFTTAQPTV